MIEIFERARPIVATQTFGAIFLGMRVHKGRVLLGMAIGANLRVSELEIRASSMAGATGKQRAVKILFM